MVEEKNNFLNILLIGWPEVLQEVLLSINLKPIHFKLVTEKPYYANDFLNTMCASLKIHQHHYYCIHSIPKNECNAFSHVLLTDTSIPYKFVSIKLQKCPHSSQRKTTFQRGPFLQPTVNCAKLFLRRTSDRYSPTVSTSHTTTDTWYYHFLQFSNL